LQAAYKTRYLSHEDKDRNPDYWERGSDGEWHVKKGVRPTDAFLHFGTSLSVKLDFIQTPFGRVLADVRVLPADGIWCNGMAQFIIIKAEIMAATEAQRERWDKEWKDLPLDLADKIPEDFWGGNIPPARLKDGKYEYLPGDTLFYPNPYWNRKPNGEMGSNVFYIGSGFVYNPYSDLSRHIFSLDGYRKHMIDDWESFRNKGITSDDPKLKESARRLPQLVE
jgi:hypothetical protein